MKKQFVVSDYVQGKYERSEHTYLACRFEARNPWWPSNRLCEAQLTDYITQKHDELTDELLGNAAPTQINHEASTQYGNVAWSIAQTSSVGPDRAREFLRIVKEAMWGTINRSMPYRWHSGGPEPMWCEAGTVYSAHIEENGTTADFWLQLPAGVDVDELDRCVKTAEWLQSQLEAKLFIPKGEIAFHASTNNPDVEGQDMTRCFDIFIQQIWQSHFCLSI